MSNTQHRWQNLFFALCLIIAQWGQASGLAMQWLMPTGHTVSFMQDVCLSNKDNTANTLSNSSGSPKVFAGAVSSSAPFSTGFPASLPSQAPNKNLAHDCCTAWLWAQATVHLPLDTPSTELTQPALTLIDRLTTVASRQVFFAPLKSHRARAPPLFSTV